MKESVGVAELRNAEYQIAFCEFRLRVWKETLAQLREALGEELVPGPGAGRTSGSLAGVHAYIPSLAAASHSQANGIRQERLSG